MQKTDAEVEHDGHIRKRLGMLAGRHGQAVIARKTGAWPSRVNRYLGGARISAAFCAGLVRNLGVNPSWLLNGQGVPYIADISADHGKQAENLLELVQTMTAISRLSLGSLAGKRAAQVLQDLNDQLSAFERTREKLSVQMRPVLEKLLEDIGRAMTRSELGSAKHMLEAAHQAARLCHDEEMQDNLDGWQANYDIAVDNWDGMMRHQRKILGKAMARGDFGEPQLHRVGHIVSIIEGMRRIREAQRTAKAALALGEKCKASPWYQWLAAVDGIADIELGELRQGTEKLMAAFPGTRAEGRLVAASRLDLACYFAGVLPATELARREVPDLFGEDVVFPGASNSQIAIAVAVFEETPEAVALACEVHAPRLRQYGSGYERIAVSAELLHKAVQQRRGKLHEAFLEQVPPPKEHVRVFSRLIAACQLARLCNERKAAQEFLVQADDNFNKRDPELDYDLVALGRHYRNALELAGGSAKPELNAIAARARVFFEDHVRKGYVCFKRFLTA